MPELPETELIAEKLRSAALNKRLEDIAFKGGRGNEQEEALASALARLQGCRITDVARYGAFLFLEFEEQGILSLNLAGEVDVQLQRGRLDLPEHNALLLRCQGGFQLLLSAPNLVARVRLLDEEADVDYLTKLGPDPLLDSEVATHLAPALGRRRTHVRAALMQDNLVAGIGPTWADEILFQSRIRPDRLVPELTPQERERLLKNLPKVLDRAVRCQAKPNLLPQNFLTRHRHDDQLCPICGGPLETLEAGSKGALFCPKCQV